MFWIGRSVDAAVRPVGERVKTHPHHRQREHVCLIVGTLDPPLLESRPLGLCQERLPRAVDDETPAVPWASMHPQPAPPRRCAWSVARGGIERGRRHWHETRQYAKIRCGASSRSYEYEPHE